MNLYTNSIGFGHGRGVREEVEQIFSQADFSTIREIEGVDRAICQVRVSERTYLNAYGRFIDGEFRPDLIYPAIMCKHDYKDVDISFERHVSTEEYTGVIELKNYGTIIFYLNNPDGYLEYICRRVGDEDDNLRDFIKPYGLKEFLIDFHSGLEGEKFRLKSLGLVGLSSEGRIILPARDAEARVDMSRKRKEKQKLFIEASNGDEDAIGELNSFDVEEYSNLIRRYENEDIYSIVNTTFMPCGVECDQYMVIGEITGFSQETNRFTNQIIYMLRLDCNGLKLNVAIASSCLVGEIKVGYRFKGRIWLQGNVDFD